MHSSAAPLTLLCLYVLPTIVAAARRHRSVLAIAALNLLFGWTAIGWVWAFIWALTGNVRRDGPIVQNQVIVNTTSLSGGAPAVASNAQALAQFAALERLSEVWERELGAIRAHPPSDAIGRIETITRLAEATTREARAVADEAREGVPPRGAEPSAIGPPTLLIRRESKDGHPYYRNDVPPSLAGYPALLGQGFFELVVVGISHHQIELDAIAGGRRDAPVYFRTNALVYPEPDNPHDPNAIAVAIGGWRIGFIARDDAPAFGAELAAIGGPGAFACRALIENGWPQWRVKLDVERPLEARRGGGASPPGSANSA